MEEKDATTYYTAPHPCREKRRLYHHPRSLSLQSPWIVRIAGHPDLHLMRSGCHNWGSLGKRRVVVKEEGLLLSSPSPLHVFAVHCIYSYRLFVELQLSLSQVRLFLHRTQQQTWPVPIDLSLLLTSVTRCLPAVPSGKCCVRHPGYFHLTLGNFHFLNVFISRVPSVHSLAAWLVMRDRHSTASFNLKQHWVYINTVL